MLLSQLVAPPGEAHSLSGRCATCTDGRSRTGRAPPVMVTTSGDGVTPLPPPVQQLIREIVADHLGWPAEALKAFEGIEETFPEYYCWWTPSPWPDPGFAPAWSAAHRCRTSVSADPDIYARTPGELAERISADIERRDAGHQPERRNA